MSVCVSHLRRTRRHVVCGCVGADVCWFGVLCLILFSVHPGEATRSSPLGTFRLFRGRDEGGCGLPGAPLPVPSPRHRQVGVAGNGMRLRSGPGAPCPFFSSSAPWPVCGRGAPEAVFSMYIVAYNSVVHDDAIAIVKEFASVGCSVCTGGFFPPGFSCIARCPATPVQPLWRKCERMGLLFKRGSFSYFGRSPHLRVLTR